MPRQSPLAQVGQAIRDGIPKWGGPGSYAPKKKETPDPSKESWLRIPKGLRGETSKKPPPKRNTEGGVPGTPGNPLGPKKKTPQKRIPQKK
ncbi:hypothetical protein NHJ13051_009565 [Beauveria bassiana]|uniref:Uncharacterized protein n=1 Tax=Beauveria bassiana D1-5 TaxID=1245745 RepID=A0A0A2V8E6_BEABA|nr:hypothetical protein BBAD15_g10994 [Beauveria bassiana D1-5]